MFRFRCNELYSYFYGPILPHSGYADSCVEELYSELSKEHAAARRRLRTTVMAGDWNASVGAAGPGDPTNAVGQYGFGNRNARGEWFLRWAMFQDISITNTFFHKDGDAHRTYCKGNRLRQIDFICVDSRELCLVSHSGTSDDIGIGVDHKALHMTLQLTEQLGHKARSKRRKKCNERKTPKSGKGWRPID